MWWSIRWSSFVAGTEHPDYYPAFVYSHQIFGSQRWRLGDNKSPKISSTLFGILANPSLDLNSLEFLTRLIWNLVLLSMISSALMVIDATTITVLFHTFLISRARSWYFSISYSPLYSSCHSLAQLSGMLFYFPLTQFSLVWMRKAIWLSKS